MIKYTHTNIIARDWKLLANFYINVFECKLLPPTRHLTDPLLAKGAGLKEAELQGAHLLLPGAESGSPTLEIFQYAHTLPAGEKVANREGFGHICFQTDDVAALVENVLDHGGSKVGESVDLPVEGAGTVRWLNCTDLEGNLIEIQKWLLPS